MQSPSTAERGGRLVTPNLRVAAQVPLTFDKVRYLHGKLIIAGKLLD
jgi:hypothetical protein